MRGNQVTSDLYSDFRSTKLGKRRQSEHKFSSLEELLRAEAMLVYYSALLVRCEQKLRLLLECLCSI